MTASKNNKNSFNYNPITVVLLTELLKMIVSSCVYLKKYANNMLKHSLKQLIYLLDAFCRFSSS